ncbi:MAG TPA: hypothetical protein VFR37_25380 [Longimicrobium sp.]|nr:hypothetical protein [Longimicrobium sp.]
MFKRIGFIVFLVSLAPRLAAQPDPPHLDSLMAHWLKHGVSSGWQPYRLLTGCTNLADWQERGIKLLLRAELSPERRNDLARAWGAALRRCRNAHVEDWFFHHVNAAMESGEHVYGLHTFWWALENADSPGIREYLRNLMLDVSRSESYRVAAGGALFTRFGPEEQMREYLSAFETGKMPFGTAMAQTELLLQRDAERLLREVGQRVRQNPQLADQWAFSTIVQSWDRFASTAARRQLGEDLQAGLRRTPTAGQQRERLERLVEALWSEPPPRPSMPQP